MRRRLAENDLKPLRRDMWRIPQVDGVYTARMEDVLDLYAEAPDPRRPVISVSIYTGNWVTDSRAKLW